jgi:hypothetical protein
MSKIDILEKISLLQRDLEFLQKEAFGEREVFSNG